MSSVVVTGAAGGLGREVVRRLEREYRVLAPPRQTLDVSSESSTREFFAAHENIYALVHLVGGWSGGTIEETPADQWRSMLDVNLTSAFLTMREASRVLTRPGRIVAISSIASLEIATGSGAYTVAKSALNALVQVMAADLRGTGITVNALAPDAMATPAMLEGGGDASRLIPPARVADAIAFLLSDAAAGTTGAIVPMRAA